MELQGDMGHVESRFGPFGDTVSVGARQVHGFGPFGESANLGAR